MTPEEFKQKTEELIPGGVRRSSCTDTRYFLGIIRKEPKDLVLHIDYYPKASPPTWFLGCSGIYHLGFRAATLEQALADFRKEYPGFLDDNDCHS